MTDHLVKRLSYLAHDMYHYAPDARFDKSDLVGEAKARIEALTTQLAEEKLMRQEEKVKILRQREQLDSIQKANRNHLPMMRGLQRRVAELEAAEADNARLLNDLRVISQFQATTSCTANVYAIWKMTERARAALTGKETK